MQSSQAIIRQYGASEIGAKFAATSASPYDFRPPLTSAPFVIEHLHLPSNGSVSYQPGATTQTFLPFTVDLITKINIRVRVAQLNLGTAAFARYPEFALLQGIQSIKLSYGTETLQTIINTDEIFLKIMTLLEETDRQNAFALLGGGLPPSVRSARAQAGAQEFVLPLYTLLGLHLGGDPSQMIATRMMGQQLTLTIVWKPQNQWVETDVFSASGFTLGSGATDPTQAAGWFETADVYCEGVHITEHERQKLQHQYAGNRRYVFHEGQYANFVELTAATALNGSNVASIPLELFTEPSAVVYVMIRWREDLMRVAGGAGGTRGYQQFNVGGWYNPGGGSALPIFEFVTLKTGSNNFVQVQERVEFLKDYEHARVCRGTAGPAILRMVMSHDPSRENAVIGFNDFSQLEKAVLLLQTRNVAAQFPTVGDASMADIGQSSSVRIDVISLSVNQLNFAKNSVTRPYN